MAMEQVNQPFDQMSTFQGNQFQHPHGPRQQGRTHQRGARTKEEAYYEGRIIKEEDRESDFIHRRHGAKNRGGRNREDKKLDNIKMKISAFQGRSNPEAYLE